MMFCSKAKESEYNIQSLFHASLSYTLVFLISTALVIFSKSFSLSWVLLKPHEFIVIVWRNISSRRATFIYSSHLLVTFDAFCLEVWGKHSDS